MTDYKTNKGRAGRRSHAPERDWNDVVDLELDGSEAAGEKEC